MGILETMSTTKRLTSVCGHGLRPEVPYGRMLRQVESALQDEHAGANEMHDALIINYLRGHFSEVRSSPRFIAFAVILGGRLSCRVVL